MGIASRRISWVEEGFNADLDSSAFARFWGGLPEVFIGVVVNLRAKDRDAVDANVRAGGGIGSGRPSRSV